jgi:N6-L-threonylcarbamoyladenine synthase
LGIETSCDDTAAAVVDAEGNILGESASSQLSTHLRNGGVIPPVARDLHNQNIEKVILEALDNSNLGINDVTAIAVTNRPGLPLSLHVGVDFAKKLAIKYRKPLIPIHHMEGHATIGLLTNNSLSFPFLTLLISGGHAQLAWVQDLKNFFLLGQAIDDAPGEAMDKIARQLKVRNLGPPFDRIPGGAALEILGKHGDRKKFFDQHTFIPLHKYRNCDFSFAGFKTFNNLILRLEKERQLPPDQPLAETCDIAACLLYGITTHILKRLSRAIRFLEKTRLHEIQFDKDLLSNEKKLNDFLVDRYRKGDHKPIKINVVVSGGVACNDYITSTIEKFCKSFPMTEDSSEIRAVIPRPKKLCTDNGIMIAWNGILKLLEDRASDILRTSHEISALSAEKKVPLGISIRQAVVDANIKPDKINPDVFPSR